MAVHLGIELEREVSPAVYLWDHRSELPAIENADAVLSAIEAGIALEQFQFGRARQAWRVVVKAAEDAGRSARRNGLTPRRLMASIDRVRDALELVLFDGRLPPDLASLAARTAAKMCTRAIEHALFAYWTGERHDMS